MNLIFSKPLCYASVQDIQLELVRRTGFNSFDGERIAASLLEHRVLWEAVVFDRLPADRTRLLPMSGLIKLRDLRENLWNVDTLYILTSDRNRAEKLAEIAKYEKWGSDEMFIFDEPDQIDATLGGPAPGKAIVRVWWD